MLWHVGHVPRNVGGPGASFEPATPLIAMGCVLEIASPLAMACSAGVWPASLQAERRVMPGAGGSTSGGTSCRIHCLVVDADEERLLDKRFSPTASAAGVQPSGAFIEALRGEQACLKSPRSARARRRSDPASLARGRVWRHWSGRRGRTATPRGSARWSCSAESTTTMCGAKRSVRCASSLHPESNGVVAHQYTLPVRRGDRQAPQR